MVLGARIIAPCARGVDAGAGRRLRERRRDGKTGKKGNRKPHARLGMGRVPIGFVSLSGHGGILVQLGGPVRVMKAA